MYVYILYCINLYFQPRRPRSSFPFFRRFLFQEDSILDGSEWNLDPCLHHDVLQHFAILKIFHVVCDSDLILAYNVATLTSPPPLQQTNSSICENMTSFRSQRGAMRHPSPVSAFVLGKSTMHSSLPSDDLILNSRSHYKIYLHSKFDGYMHDYKQKLTRKFLTHSSGLVAWRWWWWLWPYHADYIIIIIITYPRINAVRIIIIWCKPTSYLFKFSCGLIR